jgi:putative transposase
MLGTASRRDLFLEVLEQARQRHRFVVMGYVVMLEHFHLLIGEPETGDPSVVMKVVKERFSRILRVREGRDGIPTHSQSARMNGPPMNPTPTPVWQRRFYDFNVWSEKKRIEKLRYIHRNPVRRGLVEEADQWAWSSFRHYSYGELGPVRVNFQDWALEIRQAPRVGFGGEGQLESPLIRKLRE